MVQCYCLLHMFAECPLIESSEYLHKPHPVCSVEALAYLQEHLPGGLEREESE